MNAANSIAQQVIRGKLIDVFGETEWDPDHLAAEIATGLDVAATRNILAREQALQSAMQATMEYLNGVNQQLGVRIAELEAEVRRLNAALARSAPPAPATAGPNQAEPADGGSGTSAHQSDAAPGEPGVQSESATTRDPVATTSSV